MKTPEEIKKGLECYIVQNTGGCENIPCRDCSHYNPNSAYTITACKDALAYIQQLEAAQPKWISVEERLPETQDYEGEPIEYIVHVEGAELATFAIFDGERFIPSEFPGFIEKRMFAGPITHWMPMPPEPEVVE